jgi:16S rRNA (guanine527-N7)-methyltransferase
MLPQNDRLVAFLFWVAAGFSLRWQAGRLCHLFDGDSVIEIFHIGLGKLNKVASFMLSQDPLELLKDGAASLGLELGPPTLAQFRFYLTELQRWNARINLTALRTDQDIISKHFLDSLAVLPFLGATPSLADLGAGAGFPGLALKLARPDLAVTLVEAREKKAGFLEYLVSCLNLTGVTVVRVHLTPALARQWGPRFGTVVSRATFTLARFLELAAPLLLPGGKALALKGPQLTASELEAAGRRLGPLGLAGLEAQGYRVPLTAEPRLLVTATRRDGDKQGAGCKTRVSVSS